MIEPLTGKHLFSQNGETLFTPLPSFVAQSFTLPSLSAVITVATASQKGGVGKTTLCINLAYSLAKRGWRVLLVDTDPQGGVGLSLSRSASGRAGFYEHLLHRGELATLVITTRLPELEIMPAGRADASAKVAASPAPEIPSRIADLFRAAELRGVDCVLVDTAAGLTGMTEMLVKACDYVILPQQAEPLAIRSVPHMLETLARYRAEGAGVKVAGILLTMVMREHEASLRVAQELREMLPEHLLFQQSIPRLPSFLDASALGVPLALTKRNPPPEALLFDQIAAELEQRSGLASQRDKPHEHASLLD
jgi:chromosome partitioning protein